MDPTKTPGAVALEGDLAPPAPFGARALRGLQRRYLVRGLVASGVIHLAGVGAYWGAVKMSEAAPLPAEMQLVAYADVPPPPVDQPPPEAPSVAPAPAAAVAAPPSGVVMAVPDAEVDSTFTLTFASQDELAAERSGLATGGVVGGAVGGTGRVAAPPPPPPPSPPPPPPPPRAEPPPPPPEVFEVAEVQPVLIGGLAGLQGRVEYPDFARRAGIEGQVVIQFVVDERGAVTNPVVLRSPNELLSEAAIDALRESRFEPGQQRGRPVKVRFAVPVTFRLR